MRAAVPHQQPSFFPHPLAALAAAFALGILAARFISPRFNVVLMCSVVSSLAAVYGFAKRRGLATSLLLFLAFCSVGATLALLEKSSVTAERVRRLYDEGVIHTGEPVEVTGVMERAPEPGPDGFYLTLGVERLRFKGEEREASGQVLLFAPVRDRATLSDYELLELRYGARLRVMTALNRADNFRNPGVSTLTEYLERRSLDATATIKSPLLIERLDDERVFLPIYWAYEWRQRLLALIDEKFSIETSGVLSAALLGNRYQLSRSTAQRFRDGGTFHVLVISGLHISFIGGIILFLARRMTKRRVWQFIASAAFLWAFTFAVGAEVSVVRAALMFTIVALAPVLHRRARSLNALGCATLMLLIWRPSDLFDPSFQLTFLSVLAIVVISWPALERLQAIGSWRPTSETPYPPVCPHVVRALGEALFWSERDWQSEIEQSNYSYKLFKNPRAAQLGRLHLQRVLRYAFSAIVVSLSVQLTLLPLLVVYFHRLSVASLFLNIIVGALMAALALIASAALLLSTLGAWPAAPFFKLAEALSRLMVHSVDPFAAVGLASVRLPEYTGWPFVFYLLYYAPLAVLAIKLAGWNPLRPPAPAIKIGWKRSLLRGPRAAAIALALLFTLIVLHPLSAGSPDGRLQIDFLDVGQGDAALLTMPDGTTLLVDAGGQPRFDYSGRSAIEEEGEEPFERDTQSIGERVVSEYLWRRGLDHVDYILATHADADHIDGLNDIVRNFHVRAAIVGRAPALDPEFVRFAATTEKYGVPLYLTSRGDTFRFGAVEIMTLWPTRSADQAAPSGNNDSVTLRVSFGNRVFLLTGDIEQEAEGALTGSETPLQCDVVKVAHHGSRTSSTDTFVKAAHPAYAVISVGLSSIFGHPHKEVLERWRTSGAEILTTGKSGTITISTDGQDLKVETFVRQ
ncbi:MAG TPA: ComEC/Rec2 family competence protein [Pyrinomonadaceae bacterium]|nr:ComEC/Rec2 family competence protein [Pyrinomonadaceae bacterium]